MEFEKIYGEKWTETDIMYFVRDTLKSGRVIPGYGHAVLRKTDPRFLHFLEFAKVNIGKTNLIDLLNACYKVIP
jgi:citrate synthase